MLNYLSRLLWQLSSLQVLFFSSLDRLVPQFILTANLCTVDGHYPFNTKKRKQYFAHVSIPEDDLTNWLCTLSFLPVKFVKQVLPYILHTIFSWKLDHYCRHYTSCLWSCVLCA